MHSTWSEYQLFIHNFFAIFVDTSRAKAIIIQV